MSTELPSSVAPEVHVNIAVVSVPSEERSMVAPDDIPIDAQVAKIFGKKCS